MDYQTSISRIMLCKSSIYRMLPLWNSTTNSLKLSNGCLNCDYCNFECTPTSIILALLQWPTSTGIPRNDALCSTTIGNSFTTSDSASITTTGHATIGHRRWRSGLSTSTRYFYGDIESEKPPDSFHARKHWKKVLDFGLSNLVDNLLEYISRSLLCGPEVCHPIDTNTASTTTTSERDGEQSSTHNEFGNGTSSRRELIPYDK